MYLEEALIAWQADEADELVKRMEDNGVDPTVTSFNVLVGSCARVRPTINRGRKN